MDLKREFCLQRLWGRMNSFLSDFKKIIRGGNYTNTYKMAWGKALVELSAKYVNSTGMVRINFSDIAQCVFKYYWNQTIYFDLIQSSNITEEPYIIQTVKSMIELYYLKKAIDKNVFWNVQ